jgi:hypothetical protein
VNLVVVTALFFPIPAGSVTGDLCGPIPLRSPIEVLAPSVVSDSLDLKIDVPAQVRLGESVLITLHVRNTSDRELTLYLRGRTITFDLVISTPDGTEIWRRLANEMVPAIIRIETLPPGGRLTLEDVWHQRSNESAPVTAGRYRVYGELLTDGAPLVSQIQEIDIAP